MSPRIPDPAVRAMLDATATSPAFSSLPAAKARQLYNRAAAAQGPGPSVAEVRELTLGGRPARLYRPSAGLAGAAVFFHGGGWVLGTLDSHDGVCRQLALDADIVVISVDYRLAPEHIFPAAFDDAVAAVCDAVAQANNLGIDPARLAVAGDSAGGNLAAAAALAARDAGIALAGQALIYPATDATMSGASYVENAEGYFLTTTEMVYFYDLYGASASRTDWRLSPAFAPSLAGAAPALVLTGELDPLRDEGEAYGAALAEAGVATTVVRYNGMTHGFYRWGATVGAARTAQLLVASWLRTRLAP